MITDKLLAFVPIGSPLSLVGGAGVAIRSGVIDLLGVGAGVAPPNIFGNATIFGQADGMGVGNQRPELNITIGTALAGAGGLTLNVKLQAAADQGVGGGFQPSTWISIGGQDGITLTQGAANTVIGRLPWLPPFPQNLRPRFLSLLFSPVSSGGADPSGQFTAGTIGSAIVVMSRDDYFVNQQPRNYSVS
jgi:hypothetical protein